MYVPLGIRTEYSLQDGMCRVEELVECARTLGMTALGIADLQTTMGWVPLARVARASGVRPIYGVRVRLVPEVPGELSAPAELQLLALDPQGQRNILRLLSRVHLECGDEAPVASLDDLEFFGDGILALDGGWEGPVARSLGRGQVQDAERMAARLRRIFGADGFYMEVQRQGRPGEAQLEPALLRIARKLNIPIVATHDVRYLEAADGAAYRVLRAIASGSGPIDPRTLETPAERFWLESDREMQRLFGDIPEALDATRVVAERCSSAPEIGVTRPPRYKTPSGREMIEELRYECERGARRRYGVSSDRDLPVAVRDRLAHELTVIEEGKLASCFLIVQDVVRFAKKEGIPVGPGRGAAPGSLVCYALGTTEVDPLAHDLVFERFVSPGVLPDFELDVGHTGRSKLVQYATRRFGADHVAHWANRMLFSAQGAAREVGRVLGLPADETEELVACVRPEGENGSRLARGRTSPRRLPGPKEARRSWLLDVARRLEGLPRYPALHAGGLIVGPSPLSDVVVLTRGGGEVVAQVTQRDAEALGLLRIDLAGSRALTVLQETLQAVDVRTRHNLEDIPLDDTRTWRMLAVGDTASVFQLDSTGIQRFLRELEPGRFEDLVAALAVHRPGPRVSGLAERYSLRQRGLEEPHAAHAVLEPVLLETHGLMLYEEQLMQSVAQTAGVDLGQADLVRRSLHGRQFVDLARERARFLNGAAEQGLDLETTETLFSMFLRFPGFGITKAHTTAYALLSYWSSYVRAHHPVEYAAAMMNTSHGQTERVRQILADATAHGVSILGVDVNKSRYEDTTQNGALRLGLVHVRHLGEAEVLGLVEEREQRGRYDSLVDLCRRVPGLSPQGLVMLVRAGALDRIERSRARALVLVDKTLQRVERERGLADPGLQLELSLEGTRGHADTGELSEERLAALETEALDVFLPAKPVATPSAISSSRKRGRSSRAGRAGTSTADRVSYAESTIPF